MTNADTQKIVDWYGRHGRSLDDLIAGHGDYTSASRYLGTEPVLDTLRRCQAAMGRFSAMIERNKQLPRFGVPSVDRHYQMALDRYSRAAQDFKQISPEDTPESITRKILAAGELLAQGTMAIDLTTDAVRRLPGSGPTA